MAYDECIQGCWITIGLHCISVLVICTVLMLYIVHYCCYSNKTQTIRLTLKILTVFGSFSCIVCAVADGMTVYYDTNKKLFTDWYYNLEVSGHAFSNLMTYSIYLYRLHLSFKDTMYRISRVQYILLISLIILDMLSFVGDSAAYFYNDHYLLSLDIIGLILESMISALCLYYFNCNLFKLMLKMRSSIVVVDQCPSAKPSDIEYHRIEDHEYSYSHSMGIAKATITDSDRNINSRERSDNALHRLNQRQRRLIDRIVRNALLCSMTSVFWTLERVAWFVFIFKPEHLNSDWVFTAKCSTAIALMVDAVCMLFTFKFATMWYRACCNRCDLLCHFCCGLLVSWTNQEDGLE